LDAITLSALEYGGLKQLIAARLKSPLGHKALAGLAPSSDEEGVRLLQARAREALAYLREHRAPSPGEVEDPEETLTELEPEGAILEPVKIAKIISVLRAGMALRDEIAAVRTRYPRLWDLAGAIPGLKLLLGDLATKISPEGRVEDRASPELDSLRQRIAALEGRLHRHMRSILERESVQEAIQDAFVTVRNGRFVIPVKVEARRGIPGIIHGASSTGATVFLEPMETVEANNELVTLRDEEEVEIRRILSALGSRLRSCLPDLRALCRLMGEADLLAACALLARDFDCRPAETGEEILLREARHPVLQAVLEPRGRPIVPLDLEVAAGGRVLVLSGPNTGGKTVTLKTIGLLALMNQSGLLVPARRAVLPVFARILADVGDRQSIVEDLSTFSARMLRVAEMSRALETPSLVLLDEVGGGTDPEEEGALAVAIVDHFRRRGAGVIATTHHSALKGYAEVTEGAANASMEFDEEARVPTFRILPGVAGRSGGLEMAGRLGIPEEILDVARGRLSEAYRVVDDYLAQLHALVQSRESEMEKARLERETAARERSEALEEARRAERDLRQRYDAAIEEAMGRIAEAGEEVTRQVRDRATALQLKSESRRAARKATEKLRAEIAPPAPRHLRPEELAAVPGAGVPPSELEEGVEVVVRSLGARGKIESIDARRGRAAVIVRGMRMTVKLSDCEIPGVPPKSSVPPVLPKRVSVVKAKGGEAPAQINLIGKRVEEAMGLLDKFLDDTVLSGHREVLIVHGHGSGRLRAAVHSFLAEHPLVESHHAAGPGAGGTGATVAVLKD
jgi:DNA mismatch repair protein MutS2